MSIVIIVAEILILLAVLLKSAGMIRTSLVSISLRLKISPFIIGFVILSVASSLPEISVAINSSAQAVPGISLGNLLGATTFLLSFVIGVLAIKHKSIPFRTTFGRIEALLTILITTCIVWAIIDANLVLSEGLLLMFIYLGFTLYLIYKAEKRNIAADYRLTMTNINKRVLVFVAKSITGMVFLIISSNLLVNLLITLAGTLSISETVIGALFLGIGTNLPELTMMLTSKTLNENKLAAGNIVGSALVNVPVLGLVAVLRPHQIEDFTLIIPFVVALLIACVTLAYFAWTDKRITYKEGLVLLCIFLVLFAFQSLKLF